MARTEIAFEGVGSFAQAGTAEALFRLGILYATGLDGEANLVAAHKWLNLAALNGSRAALAYRKELAQEMSAADIAEAQQLAREWIGAGRSLESLPVTGQVAH